jgi:DNA-binding transcriptional regulator YdaS (Cro superfamily)
VNAHTAARKVIRRESDALRELTVTFLASMPHGTATALADHLGITKQSVGQWLNGKRPLAAAHHAAVRRWIGSAHCPKDLHRSRQAHRSG